MSTGTVKWFSPREGFGFILQEGSDNDLFIHYSDVRMDGVVILKRGQKVEYEIGENEKGRHAINVIPISN